MGRSRVSVEGQEGAGNEGKSLGTNKNQEHGVLTKIKFENERYNPEMSVPGTNQKHRFSKKNSGKPSLVQYEMEQMGDVKTSERVKDKEHGKNEYKSGQVKGDFTEKVCTNEKIVSIVKKIL